MGDRTDFQLTPMVAGRGASLGASLEKRGRERRREEEREREEREGREGGDRGRGGEGERGGGRGGRKRERGEGREGGREGQFHKRSVYHQEFIMERRGTAIESAT
jgi:hypothetical protein